jgi:hypothetical protein
MSLPLRRFHQLFKLLFRDLALLLLTFVGERDLAVLDRQLALGLQRQSGNRNHLSNSAGRLLQPSQL